MGLGCLARVITYALDLEMYPDDAYLMNNELAKSYRELTGPLANNQVAPPGFLWISKGLLNLTHADWGARLVPLLCGVAAIPVFYLLARRVLNVAGSRLATALFCTSHATIIYTTRAKPYAVDLLISVTVLWVTVKSCCGSRGGMGSAAASAGRGGPCLGDQALSAGHAGPTLQGRAQRPLQFWPVGFLALAATFAFWLSYTSMFVIGGAWIAMCLIALRDRRVMPAKYWAGLAALAVSGLIGGAVLYSLHLRRCLHAQEISGLHRTWDVAFPPLDHLHALLLWLLSTHMGRMYAYPIGEKSFGSVLPFVLWVLGILHLHRHRKHRLLAVLLAPQALLLGAACLRLYPYGGHPRVSLFLAPAMCLLIAAGAFEVLRRLRGATRAWLMAGMTLLLLGVPIGETVGAIRQRVREQRQGSIKRTLKALIAARRPADRFDRMDEPAPLAGQGSTQQIFEYYMQLWRWSEPTATGPAPGRCRPTLSRGIPAGRSFARRAPRTAGQLNGPREMLDGDADVRRDARAVAGKRCGARVRSGPGQLCTCCCTRSVMSWRSCSCLRPSAARRCVRRRGAVVHGQDGGNNGLYLSEACGPASETPALG